MPTCCHANIAGNTHIIKTSHSPQPRLHLKNVNYRPAQRFLSGHYFSLGYGPEHYPTSQTARQFSTPADFLSFSQNSVDSDMCRTLIDLDRVLRLLEQGYQVWYRSELLVAFR